jgi:hypothetical protein
VTAAPGEPRSHSIEGSATLSCWTTTTVEIVRQVFASEHLDLYASVDAGGLQWSECSGMKTVRGRG